MTTEGDTQEYGYQFEIIDSMGGEGAFKAHDDYSDDPYAEGTSRAFVLLQSNLRIMMPKKIDQKLLLFLEENYELLKQNSNFQDYLDLRNFHEKPIVNIAIYHYRPF